MTFDFSTTQLPSGTDIDDIGVAYYDQSRGEWVELAAADITVDRSRGIITARVSHFTYFAAIVHSAPAVFKASNLVISPSEANIAEEVNISATFTNTGDRIGSYEVTLKINGKVTSVKQIKLDGEESTQVQFVTIQGKAGTYIVNVDGLSGQFIIREVSLAPVVIPPSVPQVKAPSVEYKVPTAPSAPPVPTMRPPEPTPWLAIILSLVITIIIACVLVWYFGYRREYY